MNSPDEGVRVNRKMAFGLVLLLVGIKLALVGLAGAWMTEAAPVAATPEEAVEQVLQAAYKGQVGGAARYFEGGLQVWEHSPSWMEQYLDRVTDRGNAVAYKVQVEAMRGEVAMLQISTYSDHEQTNPLRTTVWHFVREGGGWVIRKVE
ncbi:MAG: hypothetical protein ACOY94_03530 [Bacillota bacterium]